MYDCGNSSALALELPQSCMKPSILTTEYNAVPLYNIVSYFHNIQIQIALLLSTQ